MKIESADTTNPRDPGINRRWKIGNLAIEWYAIKPRESWMKFDANLSVTWYDD